MVMTMLCIWNLNALLKFAKQNTLNINKRCLASNVWPYSRKENHAGYYHIKSILVAITVSLRYLHD